MTRAQIQTLIDARGEITLPHTGHYLDGPLVMKAGAYLNLSGGTLLRAFQTPGPVVVTPTDEQATSWSVRNGNLQDGGIALRPFTVAPNFFTLDTLHIMNAPVAYDGGDCGAWMGSLDRIYAQGCGTGFKQTGGTTMSFRNCFANGGSGKGWHLYAVYSASLQSCAMDNHQQQAGYFGACRGLSIDAFYMEANGTDGSPIVLFDGCDGLAINGWYSLFNTIHTGTSGTSYLMQINDSAGVRNGLSLGGSPRPTPDTKTGTGTAITLLESGARRLEASGCTITLIT